MPFLAVFFFSFFKNWKEDGQGLATSASSRVLSRVGCFFLPCPQNKEIGRGSGVSVSSSKILESTRTAPHRQRQGQGAHRRWAVALHQFPHSFTGTPTWVNNKSNAPAHHSASFVRPRLITAGLPVRAHMNFRQTVNCYSSLLPQQQPFFYFSPFTNTHFTV